MSTQFSPLLTQRLIDMQPIGGVIKQRAEDFLVDELPLIDPCGEGEHLHIGVQRAGMSHDDMVDVIARHCGVPARAVGHAGMKDKMAVTRQTVSVHLPGLPDPPVLQHPSMEFMWARRHTAKLRPGQLRGNRFSIRIRQVNPLHAPRVQQAMQVFASRGAPNAFGFQRFGHRRNGHLLGMLLAQERWQELLDELVGARGTPFPDWQREARERCDAGDFAGSVPLWARGDHAERCAVRALQQGRNPRAAVMAIRDTTRGFWMNAAQSAGFNAVLGARMQRGLFDRFIDGDLANLHPGRSLFRVQAEALADAAQATELQRRIDAFDCSPTGPMAGPDAMAPEGECLALETQVLAQTGMTVEGFASARRAPVGERRSLRMHVGSPQVESGVDEHGGYIRVAFDLPRSGYATSVLAEIMGAASTEEANAPLQME